ncbi:S-adenosylmethionine decarboxylase [Paraburkholderia sp. BL6665CI2N2]|nr:S-adenosylmethionine decarboxylase [Paraburkholderia sp. BL6665CI2N2]
MRRHKTHTWPERRFAALDIFMCGKARAEDVGRADRSRVEGGSAECARV